MKSNKFIKNVKDKVNKFNFSGALKICAIISGCLVAAGILIISIFGFNLGIDFVGGTVLNVKVGSVLEEGNNYNIVSTQVSNIVEENGFKVGYIQQEGVGDEATITVRFMDKENLTEEQMEAEISELTADLETGLELGGETLNVTVSNGTRIAASSSKSLIINSFLAISKSEFSSRDWIKYALILSFSAIALSVEASVPFAYAPMLIRSSFLA